jgi:hypothetical protein
MLCWSSGLIWAQQSIQPGNIINDYIPRVKIYAALFCGQAVTPYNLRYENHPYYETKSYLPGTLSYNQVVYANVLMRFDLYRNELSVYHPDRMYEIVLDKEKFNYAIVNGSTIILSDDGNRSKGKFLVVLHSGAYPVVRKYRVLISEKNIDQTVRRYFDTKNQYEVYVNGIPRPVRNKKTVINLFPDRKRELNDFAKQQKLDFKGQLEHSIIALVSYYESLKK